MGPCVIHPLSVPFACTFREGVEHRERLVEKRKLKASMAEAEAGAEAAPPEEKGGTGGWREVCGTVGKMKAWPLGSLVHVLSLRRLMCTCVAHVPHMCSPPAALCAFNSIG